MQTESMTDWWRQILSGANRGLMGAWWRRYHIQRTWALWKPMRTVKLGSQWDQRLKEHLNFMAEASDQEDLKVRINLIIIAHR